MRIVAFLLAVGLAMPVSALPLQDVAEAYVEARHTPGVAIALITPEGVERAVAGEGITADALFEIGSVSKVFTGILLADMVERGLVSLDTTLGELVPGGRTLDPAVAAITLRELSDHTSGLPRLPMNADMVMRLFLHQNDPYAGITIEQLFDELAALTANDVATRGRSIYSNFGVALLGHLLAIAADTPYERLMHDRVWLPLGLEGMGFTNEVLGEVELLRPHRGNGRRTSHWRLDAYNPMGGMVGSLEHMTVFVQAAMGAEPGSAMAVSIEEKLGWARSERDGRVMVWHNGRVGGFHAFIGFLPDEGRGVVVLSNASHNGDPFAVSILRGEPNIPPVTDHWLLIGMTVLFPLIGLLLLWGAYHAPVSRLHGLDALASAAFLLALAYRIGAWAVVPVMLWYAMAAGSVALAVMMAMRLRPAPWLPAGRWTTIGKAFSILLMAGLAFWVSFRL